MGNDRFRRPAMLQRALIIAAMLAAAVSGRAAEINTDWPGHQTGDYVIKDYKFVSGETLPEVKLHYRTIGTPHTGSNIVNGVLLLQGNTGTGDNRVPPSL